MCTIVEVRDVDGWFEIEGTADFHRIWPLDIETDFIDEEYAEPYPEESNNCLCNVRVENVLERYNADYYHSDYGFVVKTVLKNGYRPEE